MSVTQIAGRKAVSKWMPAPPAPTCQTAATGRAAPHPALCTRASARNCMRVPTLDRRAFTLVEMIVVTALISIMLVVAIPRLSGGLLSDGDDETARWIIATVRLLKEKAIADQKIYLLNVSPDIQRLWVTEADAADTDASTAREDGYRLPRGVRIDHVGLTKNERLTSGTIPVAFYPQGYSDKAVIRMRTSDGDLMAFFIEPFLPRTNLVRGRQGW